MSKLSLKLLKTMEKYCSGTESKILTYYVIHQNSFGFAGNIYHNDIIDLLGISKSQYYWCMDRLDREMVKGQPERPVPDACPKCGSRIEEGKHDFHCASEKCSFKIRKDPFSRPRLIYVDRSKNKRYWDIFVFDNVFREYDKQLLQKDAETGYIDLNKHFILTREFMSLNKGAYITALKLLGFMDERNPYQKYEIYEHKFMAWFNTTSKELFNREVEALRKWFVITANDKKKYLIYLKNEMYEHDSAEIINFANYVRNLSRYYKRKISGMNSREIARLVGQYMRRLKRLGVKSIDAVKEALYRVIQGYKTIEAKLVHSVLKILIKELEERKIKERADRDGPTANNFKNRNNWYYEEYLRCINDVDYFIKHYLSRGITLDDLFNMAYTK